MAINASVDTPKNLLNPHHSMLLHEQYKEHLNQEKTLLWEIHACLLKTGADQGDLTKIKDAIEGLDELFLLVIVGEFNSGKSAFVNTLLGQKVLEEGPTPTTDLINILKHGDEAGSRVLDNLRVTRFPLELLKTVNIVDTPGTNSILKEHDNALKKEPDENTPESLLALYQNQKEAESSSLQDLLSLSPAIRSAGFSDVETSDGSSRRILLLLTKNEPDAVELERVRAWTARKFGDITVLWQIEPTFIEPLPTEKRAK